MKYIKFRPPNKRNTFLLFCFFLSLQLKVYSKEYFPTPEILKDNVEFWEKIYTEISLKEGVLHDRDYPLVIYKKINIDYQSRQQRNKVIKREKSKIRTFLHIINTQPKDSWPEPAKRIVKLFKKYASVNNLKGAGARIRYQRGQKERYKKGLYRSGAYLDTIRVILSKYNVPLRLAYLPHVESSFSPHAYSKVGAAGLWQFIRSTGRIYMKINYYIDERRDPILSTYAAAKLLSHNYNEIKSWPLAITAYNHGLNGMKRAVARTGSRDIGVIIQKHKSRSFKFASKNFYSCFLAASKIAQNPKKYFPDITFAPPCKYRNIVLEYYIKPKLLASCVGISKNELEKLNPAIRPSVFSQNRLIPKGTTIHVPYSKSVATVKIALNNLPDSEKIKSPPRPKYYRIRRGDNLYTIARRLGVSVRSLALANNIGRANRIYAGQVLRIPGSIESRKKIEPIVKEILQEKKKEEIQIVEKKEKIEKIEKAEKIERVEKIEKKPSPEEIPDTLDKVFMAMADTLTQPDMFAKNGYSGKFDASIYNLGMKYSPQNKTATIRASVNETIGHYGHWLDIKTQKIRNVNRMGFRSGIRINQKIKIPGSKQDVELFKIRRLEYHMALEEDFYSQYKVTGLREKTIKQGENVWEICNNEEDITPLWLLKKYNKHTDLTMLFPGMKIWIPVTEDKTEEDYQKESSSKWNGFSPAYTDPSISVKPFFIFP